MFLRRRAVSSCSVTLVLALLAAFAAGCTRESDVLARVGTGTITLARFNQAAQAGAQRYEDPPDVARTRLLKDMVDRELLLQGAMREGLNETPGFLAYRRQLERETLRATLFQRLVGGPFAVSEAEVQELYRRRAMSTRARLIFASDPPAAHAALHDLARGDSFATVADRYNPAGMVPPGGDIGLTRPGGLLPPLDDLVRTGPLGVVLGPVPGGGEGWFLVRLEERTRQEQPPIETQAPQLAEMIRQAKQRNALLKALDDLRAAHDVAVVHGAAQAVMSRFRLPPGGEPNARVPAPGPDERRQVLATFREGRYTLGDAYDDLASGNGNRPDLAMLPAVQRWLEAQTLDRAAIAEAYRRHIQEEPQFQQGLRDRLDAYLLDGYYQKYVVARVDATPHDLEVAYERYKGALARLVSARVVSVTVRDSAEAATLAEQAAHATDLREATMTAAAGGRLHEEKLKFPSDSPVWTRFEGRMMSMRPGDIAGPYRVEDGWFVFQVMEKQQDTPPFAQLSPSALERLRGPAGEIQREALLAHLTDSLRTVVRPIELHAERLRRAPWPPAVAGLPGS